MTSPVKIYLSIPVALPDRQKVINVIERYMSNYGMDRRKTPIVNYYKPGQFYNSEVVANNDIFVFTDKLQWEINLQFLPSGVKNELKRAMQLRKDIFYAYKTKQGEIGLYKCDYSNYYANPFCKLVVASSSAIYHLMDEMTDHVSQEISDTTNEVPNVATAKNPDAVVTIHKGFDRRLLL